MRERGGEKRAKGRKGRRGKTGGGGREGRRKSGEERERKRRRTRGEKMVSTKAVHDKSQRKRRCKENPLFSTINRICKIPVREPCWVSGESRGEVPPALPTQSSQNYTLLFGW